MLEFIDLGIEYCSVIDNRTLSIKDEVGIRESLEDLYNDLNEDPNIIFTMPNPIIDLVAWIMETEKFEDSKPNKKTVYN